MPSIDEIKNLESLPPKERIKLALRALHEYQHILSQLTEEQRHIILEAMKMNKKSETEKNIHQLEKEISEMNDN